MEVLAETTSNTQQGVVVPRAQGTVAQVTPGQTWMKAATEAEAVLPEIPGLLGVLAE
jgi:hypothetical protein